MKSKYTIKIADNKSFRPQLERSEEEWKNQLTGEQYDVLRRKGTERAFTGIYDKHFENGVYKCAGCGTLLFDSTSKFNSGCGWPAFDAAATEEAITYIKDTSYGMYRIEILCTNCGGHLGHIFDDGPTETGMRYCVNSAS
ncbi:MAG TPA: peptide-methionine (R)-S-oxide reductase, partial [Bacteroidetes bacterium]|nr:peptide-methionine (R)-S-oxide reductase [Bacteroidota bacterium]